LALSGEKTGGELVARHHLPGGHLGLQLGLEVAGKVQREQDRHRLGGLRRRRRQVDEQAVGRGSGMVGKRCDTVREYLAVRHGNSSRRAGQSAAPEI
jgi:hypothetical protein